MAQEEVNNAPEDQVDQEERKLDEEWQEVLDEVHSLLDTDGASKTLAKFALITAEILEQCLNTVMKLADTVGMLESEVFAHRIKIRTLSEALFEDKILDEETIKNAHQKVFLDEVHKLGLLTEKQPDTQSQQTEHQESTSPSECSDDISE